MSELQITNNKGEVLQIFSGFPYSINIAARKVSIKTGEQWVNYSFSNIRFVNDYNGKRYEILMEEETQATEEENAE